VNWLPAVPWIRWAVLGALALVLVGGIAGAGWVWYNAQETRAREAFAQASEVVQLAQAPTPGTDAPPAPPQARARAIAALEVLLAQHPRAAIVPQAAYQLGNLRYADGQYPQSRGAFEVALAGGATGNLKALCALGVAYTWEAQKDLGKAQTAYEAALAGRGAKDFLYEELLIDLARVQEFGGNPRAALATYERLLKDVPDSRRADDIRSRIATLKSAERK
jgi:tetratricopeptide (TPR) repeat protein